MVEDEPRLRIRGTTKDAIQKKIVICDKICDKYIFFKIITKKIIMNFTT